MTDWKPAVQARDIAGHSVQTIRATLVNEAGHEIAINGRRLRVLPDGGTSSRKRSCIISEALAASERVEGSWLDPLAYLVGSLLVAGASNLWLDDEPLVPQPQDPAGQWVVTLAGDGSVDARFVGGGQT
jgi:hypothetical protein